MNTVYERRVLAMKPGHDTHPSGVLNHSLWGFLETRSLDADLFGINALGFNGKRLVMPLQRLSIGCWLKQGLKLAEFAACIANGTSIPDSRFDCPIHYSGLDYVDIPWLNISVEQDRASNRNINYYDRYCGIKGAHPRMAYCCQNMQAEPSFLRYSDLPIYLAPDNCSQYCRVFSADIDYWLWCLTQEGDSVSNAFCRWDDGRSLSSSGTLSRNGPFDPDGYWIEFARSRSSSSCTSR